MSEERFSAELEAILATATFADVVRAFEPSLRRWRADTSFARPAEAFEALPKSVRKRFAKLKVVDSAALILALATEGGGRLGTAMGALVRARRSSGARALDG